MSIFLDGYTTDPSKPLTPWGRAMASTLEDCGIPLPAGWEDRPEPPQDEKTEVAFHKDRILEVMQPATKENQ